MATDSATALLLGREQERAELYDALRRALKGERQVVVVAGDAGIGKTALVTDLSRRAEELGFTVATGHCLDIEAGISFAPVIEALSTLVTSVEDLDSRPFAGRMRALIDPTTPSSAEQLNLLDVLRLTLLEAATAGPVLLLLEDLHWADTSTRDLALAVSRTARGRLLLVLTVRTDDLHRRHPARRALAEIGRVAGGRRVELQPLERESIAGIVASISGGVADPVMVRSVLERSEGNPLYAEEIAAAGTGAVPDQLSDLFLARVDALDERSRGLARMASVDGTQVDLEILAELAGLGRDQLHVRLRELLDANVLRSAGDSLAFRHGLVREAIYDDLLPDERTRLHAELAAILQARVDEQPEPQLSVLSRLAFHWTAAHDPRQALVASERAGLVAMKIGTAEAVTHLEQALSLFDRVSDAEALTGLTKVDLVIALSRAVLNQGDGDQWHALACRAVDLLQPDTDPLVASRAHCARAFSTVFNGDIAEAEEALGHAAAFAGNEPTEERAYVLAAQALVFTMKNKYTAGLEAAERAIEAGLKADRGSTPPRPRAGVDARLRALAFKAQALHYLGRVTESLEIGESVIQDARERGMLAEAWDRVWQLARQRLAVGQIAGAVSTAEAGYREALECGFGGAAAYCGEPLVIALIWEGRFNEAERLLDEIIELGLTDPWWCRRADLALARGDGETADGVVPSWVREQALGHVAPDNKEFDVLRVVRTAASRGDRSTCLQTASSYLDLVEGGDSPLLAACAARICFEVLARDRPAPSSQPLDLRDSGWRQLERARRGLTDEWRQTYHGVQLALAEAYAARVAGEPAIDHFREAVALSEPFGAFFALEPRIDLAQELLAQGGRNEGRELLVECWTAAHEMGARGLELRACQLATRTRVPLPVSATSEGPLSRLTPREREVLDLLATGATNKTIAETLFISQKTVSVHVSNLLAKLGVENRGAAADLARRLAG